jgi:peroxiredoxin
VRDYAGPVSDPTRLPRGLPVPADDGAADHLPGAAVPSLRLPSTRGGGVDLAEAAAETLVLFVYPRTARPDEDPLPGWDKIPGARGCTPQACGFRDRHEDFAAADARVAGLSAQTPAEQAEASLRLGLPYPLLSDQLLSLADALGLPTFTAAGQRLYRRLTLVARAGRIVHVRYPVFPPDRDAEEVLAWLR